MSMISAVEWYGAALAAALVEGWPRLSATDLDWMAQSVAAVGAGEGNPTAADAAAELFFLADLRRVGEPVCWARDLLVAGGQR